MSCQDNLVFACCLILLITSIVEVHSSLPTTHQIKAKINSQHLMNNLHKQIKAKEDELKTAEAINRDFERMIQLVNILGQVDTFLTERTKAVIKKLAVLVEDEDEIKRHFYNKSDEDEDGDD